MFFRRSRIQFWYSSVECSSLLMDSIGLASLANYGRSWNRIRVLIMLVEWQCSRLSFSSFPTWYQTFQLVWIRLACFVFPFHYVKFIRSLNISLASISVYGALPLMKLIRISTTYVVLKAWQIFIYKFPPALINVPPWLQDFRLGPA